MSLTVFIAVILAAFLHAVWNAMVKKGEDKYISLTAVVLGHIPIAITVIFFTPMISFQSIPYIFASAVFLSGYEWCLLSAYRLEDYTKVYPIARGTAPIFIVIFSLLLFNVSILKFELVGILVISFGIIILSFQSIETFKNYNPDIIFFGHTKNIELNTLDEFNELNNKIKIAQEKADEIYRKIMEYAERKAKIASKKNY